MKKEYIEVVGAVIISQGRILCVQRSEKMHLSHLWEFPGGKVEAEETFEQALIREIQEELCCTIVVGERVARTPHVSGKHAIILNTYLCHLVDSTPRLVEHEDLCWLYPSELLSLSWAEADIPTVELLLKGDF